MWHRIQPPNPELDYLSISGVVHMFDLPAAYELDKLQWKSRLYMSLPAAIKCANWSRIFKHTWIHKMGTTLNWRRRDTSLGSCLSSIRYITSQRSILHRGRRSSDELKNFGMDRFHSNRDNALSLVRNLCLHGMQQEFWYISSITTGIELI